MYKRQVKLLNHPVFDQRLFALGQHLIEFLVKSPCFLFRKTLSGQGAAQLQDISGIPVQRFFTVIQHKLKCRVSVSYTHLGNDLIIKNLTQAITDPEYIRPKDLVRLREKISGITSSSPACKLEMEINLEGNGFEWYEAVSYTHLFSPATKGSV